MQSQYITNNQSNWSTIPEEHQQVCERDNINNINIYQAENSFVFEGYFEGCMEMYSDMETVSSYLNAHEGWFCRCAQPMEVESLGNNGYVLRVGRFGSFGYEVEPKIAVVLKPPVERLYLMHTIPIHDEEAAGYDVNYQAAMELIEIPASASECANKLKKAQLPDRITKVDWQLDLMVTVQFPKFIHKLPSSLIQNTGDRLLGQIVRQISPRLTQKVQKDFHLRHDLPTPAKNSIRFEKIDRANSRVNELMSVSVY
jgi:Protein of unknown function (DUF1997)